MSIESPINQFSTKISDEDLEKAAQAKTIIDKNLCKHYTYQDLARMVATNTQKLVISFNELTNKNPYQYLTSTRIEKTMNLLETTSLTIETIASKVGLDKTNLNKQFKKAHGITPNTWRKSQHKAKHKSFY